MVKYPTYHQMCVLSFDSKVSYIKAFLTRGGSNVSEKREEDKEGEEDQEKESQAKEGKGTYTLSEHTT